MHAVPRRSYCRLGGRRLLLLAALVAAALTGVVAPTSAQASGGFIPLTPPATASSVEGPAFVADNAVDGVTTTRWSSAFRDNQWLQVDLGSVRPLGGVLLTWETAAAKTFLVQVSLDGVLFRNATPVLNGPDPAGVVDGRVGQSVLLDASARYLRILGLTRATSYGFSLWEVAVISHVDAVGECDVNASRGKPATASSVENPVTTPADAAFDASTSTRWSSAFSDNQWVQVDLGSPKTLCRARLTWEAAYAKTFVIQGSLDGVTFTNLTPVQSGYEGLQSVGLTSRGTWRFIRLVGLTRATSYGISLWDMTILASTLAV